MTMNLLVKQKKTHRHRKQTWLPKGNGVVRINWEFRISRYKLLYTKEINDKVLPPGTTIRLHVCVLRCVRLCTTL